MSDHDATKAFASIESALAAGWLPVTSALWWPGQSGLRIAGIVEPERSTSGAVRLGESITMSEAIGPDGAGWVSVGPIASCEDGARNIWIEVGNGAFGGDGYIAVFALDTRALRWALFSDDSNPFVRVGMTSDRIVALTDLGINWTILIDNPLEITLERCC